MKRTKAGTFVHNSPAPSAQLATIRRDQGRLSDANEKSNLRYREANKRLALKSYKPEDYPLESDKE